MRLSLQAEFNFWFYIGTTSLFITLRAEKMNYSKTLYQFLRLFTPLLNIFINRFDADYCRFDCGIWSKVTLNVDNAILKQLWIAIFHKNSQRQICNEIRPKRNEKNWESKISYLSFKTSSPVMLSLTRVSFYYHGYYSYNLVLTLLCF